MFVHNNTVTATPCEPGVSRKVMAYNDQVMMCEITFEKGAKGNFHTHPQLLKDDFPFQVFHINLQKEKKKDQGRHFVPYSKKTFVEL